jgi:hypothetical protein
MPADLDRLSSFTSEITRISVLPENERVGALLHYFVHVLDGMEPDTIRTLRDQVMERFSTCGCSFETSLLMIELIDVHLAVNEARHVRR